MVFFKRLWNKLRDNLVSGGLSMHDDFIKAELNKYKQVLEAQIEKLSIQHPISHAKDFFNAYDYVRELKNSI